jgi:uncharacterized RDD family membrane protein YckC
MAEVAQMGHENEAYPGSRLGLARTGKGSLASWRSRVAALILDWAACTAIAVGFFGSDALSGGGWRAWMTLTVFFVESSLLGAVAAGSFGQLVCRIGIARLDGKPLGFPRAVLRAFLVSLAIPPLIIGPDRRGLQDYAAGTVVTNRR